MDMVLRATIVYFFLLMIIRATGKRELGQLSPFDFVILLIISEALQPALTDDDRSIVGSVILVCTLAVWHLVVAVASYRSPKVADVMNGVPSVLIEDGKLIKPTMDAERVPEEDILSEARGVGIESLDQIALAVLETSGKISIIPKSGPVTQPPGKKSI